MLVRKLAGPFAVSIFLTVSFAKVVPNRTPTGTSFVDQAREVKGGPEAVLRLINAYLSVC